MWGESAKTRLARHTAARYARGMRPWAKQATRPETGRSDTHLGGRTLFDRVRDAYYLTQVAYVLWRNSRRS